MLPCVVLEVVTLGVVVVVLLAVDVEVMMKVEVDTGLVVLRATAVTVLFKDSMLLSVKGVVRFVITGDGVSLKVDCVATVTLCGAVEVGTLVDGVVETFLPTRVVTSARPKLWLVTLV